jgi:hypothetical protein
MPTENKSKFLDRLKDATGVVATKAREGIEELQTKHELSQAYSDLGRTTADLVESGAVTHPDLAAPVEKIKALKAELAAKAAETETAKTTEPAEPEPS